MNCMFILWLVSMRGRYNLYSAKVYLSPTCCTFTSNTNRMTDNTPRQRQTASAKANADGSVSREVANTPQQQQQQQQQEQPPWYTNFSGIARMIMVWFAVQYGLQMLGKLTSQRTSVDNVAVHPDVPGAGAPAASDAAMPVDRSHLPAASVPLWAKDTSMVRSTLLIYDD